MFINMVTKFSVITSRTLFSACFNHISFITFENSLVRSSIYDIRIMLNWTITLCPSVQEGQNEDKVLISKGELLYNQHCLVLKL